MIYAGVVLVSAGVLSGVCNKGGGFGVLYCMLTSMPGLPPLLSSVRELNCTAQTFLSE